MKNKIQFNIGYWVIAFLALMAFQAFFTT